ncbi:MAG: murein hydrolase activator EnvC family protein [Hoylesella marshii]|uniref:murein hydrolase activator EnvC family protein n=1 Tax=Hoylesella marshii TaxID=189722 RepID=UPI003FA120B1
MKRYILLLFLLALTLAPSAQTRKKTPVAKPTTATKTKVTKKNVPPTKGKKATTKGKTTADASYNSIKNLQKQRTQIQQKIKQQEQALRANQADVKKRLQGLLVINSEIDRRQKNIDDIHRDIRTIEGNIGILKSQLQTLENELADRKAKYAKSMQYMARHRNVQDRLMFVFSAKNLTQMYRRMRFMREYADYQKAQGELVKVKQQQITEKNTQLQTVKGEKNTLLRKGEKEHAALQEQQVEQQKVVTSLQKQQKTIQTVIAQQRKKDAALNAQIDKMIAEEVARARARAEAEAKRKAEAAAAAKRKAEELARKKAEAEAAAKENARRIAEAKAAEEKAKSEARAAAKRSAEEKAKAEQRAKEAEAARRAAERKAMAEKQRHAAAVAEANKEVADSRQLSTVDRMMSGGFEANKGRLPMPITGNYRIVSHFGQYNVEGLKGVTLDNKGINILGHAGCAARSIYDGEVSAVFGFDGSMVVMVRHGAYISVYCNLKSVSVSKGQKVSTRQMLGTVGSDNILQFQLRRETAKLNPEVWLGR